MKMKFTIFLILLYHTSAKAQIDTAVIEILSVTISDRYFDSKYFREDSQIKTFLVIKEGAILSFIDSTSHQYDLLKLKNGNQIAFNSKGWMFMIDAKYYLKLSKINLGVRECLLEIECIEFNGFKEKVLGYKNLVVLKEDDVWKISKLTEN